MEHIFIQIAILLTVAFIVSYIFSLFRQPIIVGYIVAGILISPFIVRLGFSTEIIEIFSKFGIAFLLFIVGLHLNPKTIKEIGFSSLIIGIVQIILTFVFTFFVSSKLLGFDVLSSIYIGVALAFSSTILIMKLFSDKQNLDSLYAKISIGILIVQDIVAAGFLMFMSSMSGGDASSNFALINLLEVLEL